MVSPCLLDLGGSATAKLESGGDASASPSHVQQHVQLTLPVDETLTSLDEDISRCLFIIINLNMHAFTIVLTGRRDGI